MEETSLTLDKTTSTLVRTIAAIVVTSSFAAPSRAARRGARQEVILSILFARTVVVALFALIRETVGLVHSCEMGAKGGTYARARAHSAHEYVSNCKVSGGKMRDYCRRWLYKCKKIRTIYRGVQENH